ncbi:MAG: response regulator SirA [Candidatus Cloacimonetes bacterium]|nr:response regulator SirA [Candidatus Cloacimonadota bacterium]
MSKFTHVIKRSGAIVPFRQERIANAIYRAAVAVGGRDKKTAENLAEKVVADLEKIFPEKHNLHIEEIQDVVEKVLIKNGHSQVAKAYILYRNENIKRRMEKVKKDAKPSENIPWTKIWHIMDWAVSHNVHTIEALNERIRKGEFPHLVHESEAAYEDDVATAANYIAERSKDLKMVFISGPSSSGKTTTTIKLEKKLKKTGLKFKAFVVDNYFFDLKMHPKDEFGDFDFETPQALDLQLINEHIKKICDEERVLIPYYDFKTGTRYPDRIPVKLDKNEILLIDSLHGLYPKMSEGIPDEYKFKVYLEPLLQMKAPDGRYIRWTDIRMIRRMLRDSVHRAYNPMQTLEHWHYVRSSETRHIIPFINTTDYIINSGMPYEIALYKARLFKEFEKWNTEYKDHPLKEDAYERASRVYNVLKSVEPVEDDSPVPADSVLREFIGGSIYEY